LLIIFIFTWSSNGFSEKEPDREAIL